MKPATERYVRAVHVQDNIELILGVAYMSPDEYFPLLSTSKMLLRDAVDSLAGSHAVTNPAMLAEAVEREVVKQWPDRYWFIEVSLNSDRDGWTQVYQKPTEPEPIRIYPMFGAGQESHDFACKRWSWPPSDDCTCHAGKDNQ